MFGTNLTIFIHKQTRGKMATASSADEILDYTQGELNVILRKVDKYEREELGEFDIDVGGDSDEEFDAESEPDDNLSLACLQTNRRPATTATPIRDFVEPTGPGHNLPFCFFLERVYETALEETQQVCSAKSSERYT